VSVTVDVQRVVADGPDEADIRRWVTATLQAEGHAADAELTVRIVDEAEITELNRRYRHKDRPTNVLAFPFEAPPGVETELLGDLVIAAPVVRREAAEQGKAETAHWAHLVVHGTLHLLGHDHLTEAEAERMEGREVAILDALGFPNPYQLSEAS